MKLIALILFYCHVNWVLAQINMTNYYRMPPMALMDDYDRCLTEFPGTEAVYCYVQAQIQPDDSSPVWQIVAV